MVSLLQACADLSCDVTTEVNSAYYDASVVCW